MPLNVPGQISSALSIDGADFPLNTNPLTKIYINSNVRSLLPAVSITVPDFGNFFGRQTPINDGSKLVLNVSDGQSQGNNGQSSKFIAFGTPKREPTRDFNIYKITGILDAAPFIRASPGQAITGTSVKVMQSISQTLGFNYTSNSNVSTNDMMTWRPGRHHWGNFMLRVAKHGYVDSSSALHAAVDEQHNLYYENIPKLYANSPIKAVLYYGAYNSAPSNLAPKSFQCLQYKGYNRSGMLNNSRGYGLRMTQTDPLGGSVNKYTTVVAQTASNNLDINKVALNSISQYGKLELPPLNMQNTHPNYILARHQNSRLLCTYAQNVYVTVAQTTGLTLFDLVQFNSNSSAYGPDYSTGGFYVITAITRCHLNGKYWEKLELCSSGPQSNNSALV